MRREPIYARLCHLLGTGLGLRGQADAALFADKQTDWENLFRLSREQAVAGIVWDGLLTLPKELQPEKALFYRWMGYVLEIERANKHLNTVLRKMDSFFANDFKLPYVVLKGQGIAALYPRPEHRSCGDIDLYAGAKGAKELDRLFPEKGFRRKTLSTKHSNYYLDGIEVENHYMAALFFWPGNALKMRELVDSWFPRGIVSRTMHPAEEGELLHIPVAPSWFEALFAVIQFSSHLRLEGVGLRQLCDWYMLTHQPGLDRERYSQGLHFLGLSVLNAALERLSASLLEERKVRLSRAEREVERAIWEGGNFGHHADDAHDHTFASAGGFLKVMGRLFLHDVRRSCRFFRFAPMECLLTPLFRVAGYVRRKGGVR